MGESLRNLVWQNLWLTNHEWDPFDLFILKKASSRQGLPLTWVQEHLGQDSDSGLRPLAQAGLVSLDAASATYRATGDGQRLAAVYARTVVVVLESPHRDEYVGWGSPPFALGETGRQLSDLIDAVAVTSEISLGVDITQIPLIFCNPVSYPASLRDIGRAPTAAHLENSPEMRQDFIERLESYDPIVIINACAWATPHYEEGAVTGANTVTKVVTEHWGQRIVPHPIYQWRGGGFEKQGRPESESVRPGYQQYGALFPSDTVYLVEVI